MQATINFDLTDAVDRGFFLTMLGQLGVPGTSALTGALTGALISAAETAETTSAADMQKKVNQQAAAAKARAAKAAKTSPTPVEDVLGPAEPPPEANGAGDQVDDLGLIDPSMSPAEAKEQGLVLVREVYAAGKVAEVKALQKEWQVAKFYDVPDAKGHEFFARVMKMAVETGIRK